MSMSKDSSPDGDALAQTPRTQKVGRVVSDKMDKTVVVAVDYVRRHPLYHKRITRTSKFLAHDDEERMQDRAMSSASRRRGRCRRTSIGLFAKSSSAAVRDLAAGVATVSQWRSGRKGSPVIQPQTRFESPTTAAPRRSCAFASLAARPQVWQRR